MNKFKAIISLFVISVSLLFLFQNCHGGKFQSSNAFDELRLSSLGLPSQTEPMVSSLVKNSFTMPFTGNGHNTTWDGRVVIYTTGTGWEVTVFRPEKVQAEQGVSINLGSMDGAGAFSQNMGFLTLIKESESGFMKDFSKDSIGNKSIFTQLNALTLAPATGVAGVSNPFKSDDNGNPSSTGMYETYDLYVYTQHYGDPAWGEQNSQIQQITNTFGAKVFGRLRMKVIVQNAKTAAAKPVRTILVKDFEVMKTASGSAIRGIEPSVTTDGKLMIFNANGEGGNGDEIKYIYSSNPSSISSWTAPKNITYLNSESDSFKAQYALARQPLRSSSGTLYSPGESVLGAYPWISWEGSEITFMAAHAHHPTAAARRTGFSVVGRWTGNKVRHIDGSFNKDTKGTQSIRLFTSALGSTSSIWNPFKEVKNPQLPFLFESPSFFMISSNTGEFSELGFHDFVDGRYEVSLPMNPMLKKVTNAAAVNDEFDFNQTADLSQNNLNGTLMNGASFPLETSNGIVDSVNQIGFRGQAIQFPQTGSVTVNDHAALTENNFGSTYEIFVKPIVDLSVTTNNSYLYLIHKPGTISLILEKNRQLTARISINGKEFSAGFVGTALDLNQWTHVAVSHDPVLGSLKVFVNGLKVSETKVDLGVTSKTNSALIIGPGGQNSLNQSSFLLHLDEFKYSSVARSSAEIADSAAIPYSKRNQSTLASLLPSMFTTKETRLPSEVSLAADKVQLGFLLFNDQRLSVNNKISCASCHSATNAFADPVDFSVGVLNTKLSRHSPVLFNRIFSTSQMWDGRFSSMEQQSSGPVTHPSEMGMSSYQELVDKLKTNSSYVKAFQTVYNSEIKPEFIENALATFQMSLVTQKSKYDSYFTEGQITALTNDEIAGKDLFFGKAKCAACHTGPNFTDELYHNTGLFPSDSDRGRGDVTRRAFESRYYKTPTLRNLAQSAPYMHNGSLQTLEQVVQLYNAGGLADSLRDPEIKPLNLTTVEAAQLVSFLKTLTSNIQPLINFNSNVTKVEDAYPVTQTVVNGGWSLWSNTGVCSKTCGGGLQNQTRSCTNPAPANGGSQCSGSTTQQIACNTQACTTIVNGGWSDWVNSGTCSKTCGGGLQNQTRSCTNPAPANGGSQCSGSSTQQISCNTQACPQPESNDFIVENSKILKPGEFVGNDSLKLYFQNDGNLVLYKNTIQVLWASGTQQSCPLLASCQAVLQSDGNFVLYIGTRAYWNTQTAGLGALRLKVSEASPYLSLLNSANVVVWSGPGFKIDTTPVVTPVNGGWSSWVNSGTCSKTCGGGLQNQTRSCTNPAPANGGVQCSGSSSQQIACNTQACPQVDSNEFIVENSKSLKPGEFWGNSILKLYFQHDGHFVLYKNGTQVLWKSNTQEDCNAAGACQAVLQDDGNLVLYVGSRAYWNTETWGKGALRLKVSDTSPYLQLINSSGSVFWRGY